MIKIFKKDGFKTRHIGQVYGEQLKSLKTEGDALERLSYRCENCRTGELYNLYENSRLLRVFGIPAVQCDTVYFFKCTECNYGFVLQPDEFALLERLAVMNRRYMEGKLAKSDYDRGLRSFQA